MGGLRRERRCESLVQKLDGWCPCGHAHKRKCAVGDGLHVPVSSVIDLAGCSYQFLESCFVLGNGYAVFHCRNITRFIMIYDVLCCTHLRCLLRVKI